VEAAVRQVSGLERHIAGTHNSLEEINKAITVQLILLSLLRGDACRAGIYNRSCNLVVAALWKTTASPLDLRLEGEQCIARLRQITADRLFNCVATRPARFGARMKALQISLNFRKICAAEVLLVAQLNRHER
jgi:hypothetical protein